MAAEDAVVAVVVAAEDAVVVVVAAAAAVRGGSGKRVFAGSCGVGAVAASANSPSVNKGMTATSRSTGSSFLFWVTPVRNRSDRARSNHIGWQSLSTSPESPARCGAFCFSQHPEPYRS